MCFIYMFSDPGENWVYSGSTQGLLRSEQNNEKHRLNDGESAVLERRQNQQISGILRAMTRRLKSLLDATI